MCEQSKPVFGRSRSLSFIHFSFCLNSSKSSQFHPHVPRARAPQQLLFWGNTCVSVVAPFPHVFPCLNSSVDNDVDGGCDDICLIPLAHFSFLRQSRAAGRQDPAPQLSRETNMSCRFEHLQLGIHDHEEAFEMKRAAHICAANRCIRLMIQVRNA